MSLAEKFIIELSLKKEIKSLLFKDSLERKDYIQIIACRNQLQNLK